MRTWKKLVLGALGVCAVAAPAFVSLADGLPIWWWSNSSVTFNYATGPTGCVANARWAAKKSATGYRLPDGTIQWLDGVHKSLDSTKVESPSGSGNYKFREPAHPEAVSGGYVQVIFRKDTDGDGVWDVKWWDDAWWYFQVSN